VDHKVLGLARSDAGAASSSAAGVWVHRGDLQDLKSLRSGAAVSDGLMHTAFNHDLSKWEASGETDRRAIEAPWPLIVTSGTGSSSPRAASRQFALLRSLRTQVAQ